MEGEKRRDIYRGYRHFPIQLRALSAHSKPPQTSLATRAEGMYPGDYLGRVWALRERMGRQSQSPDPKDSCNTTAMRNSTDVFTQREMEHRGLMKNQLNIARECKIKAGDGILNGKEKGRSIFSQGWLTSPCQLQQGWLACREMGIQKRNRAGKEGRSFLSCHCGPMPPNTRRLEN